MKPVYRFLRDCTLGFLLLFSLVPRLIAAEPRKISFGYSSIGPMMHGLWMAKETGAFEKYGIEAELVFIATGPVVVQALLGGDLHAGIASTSAVIGAALNGAPILAVASMANHPYHRLWVQPEITHIEDLRGKTLGITRFGSLPHQLTLILLRKNGLEGAVKLQQYGDTRGLAAAFEQRAIAGTVTSYLRVAPQVQIKRLVNLVDMGIYYSTNAIVVSRDFYRRSPKTVDALMRAYVEGVAALKRDKSSALKVIAKYSRVPDSSFVENEYSDSSTYLERVPRVEKVAVAAILESLNKKDVGLEAFADNSVVDRLAKEGFIDKLYKTP